MRLRRRIWAAAALAALLCAGPAAGASNPFLPGNAPAPRVVRNLSGVSVLTHWQRALQSRMTALMDISTPAAVGTLTLVAGIYGVVHALGPGHQKTLLAGLVLSQGATLGQAATAAFLTAALHAGSSIVLIGGTALALGMGVTLFAVEMGAMGVRRGLIPLGKGDPRRGDRIRTVLEVGGSLLVLAFAVLLAF